MLGSEGTGFVGRVEGLFVEGDFPVEIVVDGDVYCVGVGEDEGFGPGEGGVECDSFADAS